MTPTQIIYILNLYVAQIVTHAAFCILCNFLHVPFGKHRKEWWKREESSLLPVLGSAPVWVRWMLMSPQGLILPWDVGFAGGDDAMDSEARGPGTKTSIPYLLSVLPSRVQLFPSDRASSSIFWLILTRAVRLSFKSFVLHSCRH